MHQGQTNRTSVVAVALLRVHAWIGVLDEKKDGGVEDIPLEIRVHVYGHSASLARSCNGKNALACLYVYSSTDIHSGAYRSRCLFRGRPVLYGSAYHGSEYVHATTGLFWVCAFAPPQWMIRAS